MPRQSIRLYDERFSKFLEQVGVLGWIPGVPSTVSPGSTSRIDLQAIAMLCGIPRRYFGQTSSYVSMIEEAALQYEVRFSELAPFIEGLREDEVNSITHGDVIKKFIENHLFYGVSESSVGTYVSALRSWMQKKFLEERDLAIRTFERDFESFIKSIRLEDINAVTISKLHKFRSVYLDLIDSERIEPFSKALEKAIKQSRKSLENIASSAGVKVEALKNWQSGYKIPRNIDSIRKIEEVLQIPLGTLFMFLPADYISRTRYQLIPSDWWPEQWIRRGFAGNYRFKRTLVLKLMGDKIYSSDKEERKQYFDDSLKRIQSDEHLTDYGKNLKILTSSVYRHVFKDFNPHLKLEWKQLESYKTGENLLDSDQDYPWQASSLTMARESIESFFGFIILKENKENPILSGMGLGLDCLSLGQLIIPKYFVGYLNFQKIRSKAFNGGFSVFIARWGALLKPESGWLWKNAHIFENMSPIDKTTIEEMGGWKTACEASYLQYRKLLGSTRKRGQIMKTRPKFERILPIIENSQPAQVILYVLRRQADELKLMGSFNAFVPYSLATKWRNHLLIAFLIRFPLRAKHWVSMKYKPDNTGNLRFAVETGWQLVLPYSDFKNYKNKNIFTISDDKQTVTLNLSKLEIFGEIIPLIEAYTKYCLPLLSGGSGLLFPSSQGKQISVRDLSQHVNHWTRENLSEQSLRGLGIEGVKPFSTHAFRDSVAIHILKITGSEQMAADILLDSVEVVRANYLRFLPEDRLKRVFSTMTASYAIP